ANIDEDISDLFADVVRTYLDKRFALEVLRFKYAEDVLEGVGERGCDLCVLVLNNIVFRDGSNEAGERIRRAISLVTQLKTAGAKIVIATTGCIDAADMPQRVREAGADSFLVLPGGYGNLMDELRRVLGPR
ncbi:MAG: hypothetical protein ABMA01_22015, partial [Chthoniobacteraceae bacterium]